MDWLTFLSKLIDSLVWPAVTLLIVYWLKDAIAQRLKGLRKLKWGDKEADFAEELKEIEAEAEKANLPRPEAVPKQPLNRAETMLDRVDRLSDISPDAAIIEAWREVEAVIIDLAFARKKLDAINPFGPMQMLRFLEELMGNGELDQSSFNVYRQLRHLRNQAAHNRAGTIDKKQAVEFGSLSVRLAAKLQELLQKK